jgi:D-xylose transport system substrate-binding protein
VKRFGRTGLILVLLGGIAALAVSAAAVAGTKSKSASVQVCVLLPDTKSSVRWTQFDPKYIGAALKKANVTYSFDGTAVGAAQANGIIAAMKAKHTYKKSSIVAELWGGQTDQNAFWFKSGNDKVLNPLFKHHKLKKGPQKFVPDWDANNAAGIYDQMLLKTNNKIKGVIAANDNIAGAVIAREKAHHLKPVPLSGQDTTAAGVQQILAGWQSGTVYKYVPLEANAAAAAAIALLHGKKPASNSFRMNGTKKEPTLVIPVKWITKSNYKQLFKQGWLKKSEVCVGQYKKYCK